MSTTTLHPAETLCPRCGDVTLRVAGELFTREPAAGGLWELYGEPDKLLRRRRPTRHLADEFSTRHLVHGGGHDRHVCPDEEPAAGWWTR